MKCFGNGRTPLNLYRLRGVFMSHSTKEIDILKQLFENLPYYQNTSN